MLITFKKETCREGEGILLNTEHITLIDTTVPRDADGEHVLILTDIKDPDDSEDYAFLLDFPNEKAKEKTVQMIAAAMKGIQVL